MSPGGCGRVSGSGGLAQPSVGDSVVLVLPDSHYLPPASTPPPLPLPLPIPDKVSDLDWAVAFHLHDTIPVTPHTSAHGHGFARKPSVDSRCLHLTFKLSTTSSCFLLKLSFSAPLPESITSTKIVHSFFPNIRPAAFIPFSFSIYLFLRF